MQGRLTNQPLEVTIDTRCAHCTAPLRIEMNEDMVPLSVPAGATPLVSVPIVDVKRLKDPSIIHAF